MRNRISCHAFCPLLRVNYSCNTVCCRNSLRLLEYMGRPDWRRSVYYTELHNPCSAAKVRFTSPPKLYPNELIMRVATGRVVGGKVVLEGEPFTEGSVVTVIASEDDGIFDVSADEEQALLAAIAQAERGQVVSWDELRQQLRYGA